jgi:glycosyltransferase involved in cell wall biosynthesis
MTISKVLRDELIERGVESERIVYYPNCIDPLIFDPNRFNKEACNKLRQQYNIPEDAIVLTFIGTFGVWHGVDILAQAIRKLIEEDESWLTQRKVHFLLVGDGARMPLVKEILQPYLEKTYLTLTGLITQEKAPAYLAASDILLSPHVPNTDGTKFFGSPTKLFEYMAMGKAIIASDLEQIGEILENSIRAGNLSSVTAFPQEASDLAVLCKPGNVEELIESIRFLVENPVWRSRLGKNVQQEALEKYTWKHHVDVFLMALTKEHDVYI